MAAQADFYREAGEVSIYDAVPRRGYEESSGANEPK